VEDIGTTGRGPRWSSLPTHRHWLAAEADRLLDFSRASVTPDGFGPLDERGVLVDGAPTELYITTRMTYVHALAVLWGRPGSAPLVRHGIASLAGSLHDDEHGGWFTSMRNSQPVDATKNAYETSFVVLSTSAALTAGVEGALPLLEEALEVLDRHFWSAADGLSADAASTDFSVLDPYRGANANMHLTEAYLAAADALAELRYRDRALSIAGRLIDGKARRHGWRLPEHYDEDWQPLLEYHRDEPRHPRQPYGVTPGHLLEWSRLLLSLEHGLPDAPDWLLEAAVQLFDRAVADGWGAGAGGLVYTVGHDGVHRGPPVRGLVPAALGLGGGPPPRPDRRQLAPRGRRGRPALDTYLVRQARRLPRAAGHARGSAAPRGQLRGRHRRRAAAQLSAGCPSRRSARVQS
jgi:sulfoquinovose isomerase